MARIEAGKGIEADCREHAAEALRLAQEHDAGALEVHLSSVAGLLALSLGNIPNAVDQLEGCSRQAAEAGLGHPPTVPYEPDLVEALRAAGRDRDARNRGPSAPSASCKPRAPPLARVATPPLWTSSPRKSSASPWSSPAAPPPVKPRAQLFLSPKTIEAHLGRAYRKLGVRNRAQLATTLTRQAST